MKILHTVESYLPAKHGMSEVVRQISERLADAGHEVTVATSTNPLRTTEYLNGVKVVSFNIKGNEVSGIEGETDLFKAYLLESDFDIITNFAAQQWATDICLPLLDRLSAKKVFVPTGFSGLFNPLFKSYYEQMKDRMKLYDMNVFLSDSYRDIEFARSNGITKTILIPNGASKAEFLSFSFFNLRKQLNLDETVKVVLHVGSYTGIKGHDEAIDIYLASKTPNTALVFIGENFDYESDNGLRFMAGFNWFKALRKKRFYRPWAAKAFMRYIKILINKRSKNIYLLKLSRESLIAAYQQADLLLFPSNVECSPVVLFESMAAKTPFLVTDVGNSAEIIKWSESGLLMPTMKDANGYSRAVISQSAELMDKMLLSDMLMKEMGEKGFQNWLSDFTWEGIADKYECLYKSLIKE